MYEALHQTAITMEVITGEKQYTLWYQHKKNKFSHSIYTWRSCSFFTSVKTGVQMGETSRLGWLIGRSSRDIWADSPYSLYVVLGSVCMTFASFQHILWLVVLSLSLSLSLMSKYSPQLPFSNNLIQFSFLNVKTKLTIPRRKNR
jgi:hypothetical protein